MFKMFPKIKPIFLTSALLMILLFFGCSRIKNDTQTAKTAEEIPGLQPIDIPAPDYFFMLRPWKKGTLVTMDGEARFAELSFVGSSRIKIKALVNCPRERIDPALRTIPEVGICVTQSGAQKHVADISTGKTKSFAPLVNRRFSQGMPNIFDPASGLISFDYYRIRNDNGTLPWYNFIYDPKNDKVIYQSPNIGEDICFLFPFTKDLIFTQKGNDYFFYNLQTREITRNDLTKKYTLLNISVILRHDYNINLAGRFLFADNRNINPPKKIKITWDENYENVNVIPLDYLIPEGKWLTNITISTNGKWATVFVNGFRGLHGEYLVKRAFFHLDERYPNSMSIPIITNEYDEYHAERGSFVEHPVYGWCFADRADKEDSKGNEKRYLRLYRMDDVFAEIERQR